MSRNRSSTGGVRRLALPLAAMVAVAWGCVLKSPPDTAALKADALPAVQVPSAWTATATGSVAAADNWLGSFADPQLTAAVDEAMLHKLGRIPRWTTVVKAADRPGAVSFTPEMVETAVETLGTAHFGRVVRWATESSNTVQLIDQLERLDIKTLQQLNAAVGVSTLKAALDLWRRNQGSRSPIRSCVTTPRVSSP